ncbi:MAG: HAMP domain-containing histidine kinase [Leptolyngbya sp. SIOISBB]|nr:HAMP domain-containing histidine kinase [Leptolyngbya sp. SIOISBB]
MPLPSLAEFIRLIPASVVFEPPSRWLADCVESQADYLVLLDQDGFPLHGLSLNQLLSFVNLPDVSRSALSSPHVAAPREPEMVLATLEETADTLALIELQTPIETAIQRVVTAPEQHWVVVDQQQRYQGMLDLPSFLAAAVQTLSTEGHQVEIAAIKKENLASQSNTALLTYLGHELKTPLTSLLGLSSLLKMSSENLTTRQVRYTSLIQQHCRRLAAWVNTLVDLGRIESGTLQLVPQVIDLDTLWSEAYGQAALRAGLEPPTTPVATPLILQTSPPLTLVADQVRLRQMLSCLMQTALASSETATAAAPLPLDMRLWNNWIGFSISGVKDQFSLEHLSQAMVMRPFGEAPAAATPLSAEMGHWLEWLLVRKLAQLHQGDLVMTVQQSAIICPTLLLPISPLPAATRSSRFLLTVAPFDTESLATLWQQANQLNYQLLITSHIQDALEVATHLPVAAVLVLLQSQHMREDLQVLRTALTANNRLLVALVPPHLSAYLGELPVDRELLWPTDGLGSVLLHPPTAMPSPNRLTILYLRSGEQSPSPSQQFPHIFHDFGCRVLEVDDLQQASLLRRVWQPDVAVLDPEIADPQTYLQTFSQFAELTSLPLITLTMAATQSAHAIKQISVFPCLVAEASWSTPESAERMSAWLVQVLQVAATERTGK